MKKIIYIFLTALLFNMGACTGDFEEINENPYQITDESLTQDFNNVGAFYPPMLKNLFGHQIEHNLSHDSWVRHLATPTPFTSGINNTTYYIRWNTYWNRIYGQIMSPSAQVIKVAEAEGYPVFVEWAKLIRIMGMHRLTAYHGPVIFTKFGQEPAKYDSEPDLYNAFFTQLDEIQAVFNANTDYVGLSKFDATYKGNIGQWNKFINSLRLRLAIRISKVNPALAKTQGEKALSEPGGLIETNGDNCMISLYGAVFPPVTISFGWGDTRMSASMESILIGYKDPRVAKFFDPATDDTLYPDHPDYPYKGIRNGALLVAKGDRLSYSNISSDFKEVTNRRFFTAAETMFLKAEAALRGWAGAGDAKENYESGVNLSFADWGAGSPAAYLTDNTSLPLDYNDPKADPGPVNDFVSRITNTVAWDDGASDELKLEKIITQKWIDSYTNSIEPWVDHRRTGYPKLPYNYKNDSNADWGVIPANDFLRRQVFLTSQRENNAASVAEATGFLGGPDEIGTRLWWDTGGPNF
ncbi:SusD/RagB family nutrient-binding outer membrane lipoprotein [Aureibaculum sp. 2210JD6-5]|uniref:SusD/RagB family nutrient-binding outer membrane lipoprotein n=1 Tax=Aureibaculum sp. 2210JD6-5 TaxID=3103957 RepID=UPI002AAE926A|nr:SusD/RagB family nutrient-binding outer membrane lipoprotein [Aureibaculum sp. 2210JD6-5]MDY7394304.1 SusD/RagB family nutrient-binding outer membrane lipoprotein [Aureibaculum sp. 2210JD6-5]